MRPTKLHSPAVGILAASLTALLQAQEPAFVRGDANLDGRVSLADASFLVDALYLGGPKPKCLDAVDTDDDGRIDVDEGADLVALLDWLYRSTGARALPAPFPLPGPDPTSDALDCADPAVVPPGPPAPGFELGWETPPVIQRGAKGIEFYILGTTAEGVACVAAAYRVDRTIVKALSIDVTNTILPRRLQESFTTSPAFRFALVPSADRRYFLLLAGAIFVVEPEIRLPPAQALEGGEGGGGGGAAGLERIEFPATEGPIAKERLFRVVLGIEEDAPLGKQQLFLPAEDEDFLVAGSLVHGGGNEFGPLPGQGGGGSYKATAGSDDGEILADGEQFLRGNMNLDEKVDISDAISTFGYLFLGAAQPSCLDAVDANDDGQVDISDPTYTLNWLFLGKSAPPDPGPLACGFDGTGDSLAGCSPGGCE
jgi:hypothetical protein